MNKSYKLIPIPLEHWSEYHKAIKEILTYSYPDRRRKKEINKYIDFDIMVSEDTESKEQGCLFLLKIYDQSTGEMIHILIYPAETDLYIILNDLIEAEIL